MNEWALALSALGTIGALGGLFRLFAKDLVDHIDRRFAEAESRRMEASALWGERLAMRDRRLDELAGRIDAAHGEHPNLRAEIAAVDHRLSEARAHLAAAYVSRDTYLEAEGRTMIKLDKILERLNKLDPPHG